MYFHAPYRMAALPAAIVNVFSGPPVIGIDNIFSKGPLTASSEATDFQKENVYDGLTYTFWRPTSIPATLQVTSPAGQYINYFGLAAHTLGSSGCTFKMQYYDGAAWQDLTSSISPITDKVIFQALTQIYTNKVRINILSGSSIPSIGVMFSGAAFVFQRNIYIGHQPIALNRTLEFAQNISEKELDLGRSVANKGAKTNVKVSNLTPDWVRNSLAPVVEQIITKPFFFCWRPATFPEDSAYCWMSDAYPNFSNNGKNNLMDFEINLSAMVI